MLWRRLTVFLEKQQKILIIKNTRPKDTKEENHKQRYFLFDLEALRRFQFQMAYVTYVGKKNK